MLWTCIVLVSLARLGGAGDVGDVSCSTACARCGGPPWSELNALYCSLCAECRARRRDWLQAGPAYTPRNPYQHAQQVQARRPNYYREESYYKRDATVWNEPGHYPGCPPAPSCADGGQVALVKVYGLPQLGCPPIPACAPAPAPHAFNPMWTMPPQTRRTMPSSTSTQPPPIVSYQCCPMFLPMMPCICPFGMSIPGPNLANMASQVTTVQLPTTMTTTTSRPSGQTEPVYLYIGIPKEMQSLVDKQI